MSKGSWASYTDSHISQITDIRLKETYEAVAKDLALESDNGEFAGTGGSPRLTKASSSAFGNSVGEWPAFEDSAKALKLLHDGGLKLVILSNVDNDSFSR